MSQKRITWLERAVARADRVLESLRTAEEKARTRWTKEYHRFTQAARDIAGVKDTATKKAQRLRDIIFSWDEHNADLTSERDAKREEIRRAREEREAYDRELAILRERLERENAREDSIVREVFELSGAVVEALARRNGYLMDNVYPLLRGEDGKMRTQFTLNSTDQRRRVVVLVNHITRLDTRLAGDAHEQIGIFLERFSEERRTDATEEYMALIGIVRDVVTVCVTYKVGPEMYRFLDVAVNADVFPELAKAQALVRRALRSEKTTSYVRLYEREAHDKPWTEVKLGV